MNKFIQYTSFLSLSLLSLQSVTQAATITISGNQVLQGQSNSGELDGSNNGGSNNSTALQVRNGYTLTVQNGAVVNTTQAINLSQGVAGNGANITQNAGTTVNIGTSLSMSGNTTGGTSFYTVNNATLGITNNLIAGSQFLSTFTTIGDSGSVSVGANVNALANSVFEFELGAGGATSIDAAAVFNLTTGAALNVDGSSYTGGAGTINLFSYASAGSADEFIESVSGFAGFTHDVVYTATSVDLVLTAVPEPSSTALLGLGGLAVLLRRRK